MVQDIPLPRGTAALVQATPSQSRHPGLQLDKFIGPCGINQAQQKEALKEVCGATGDALTLHALLLRRQSILASLSAQVFRYTTIGLLTLHLARASATENAGICLHPLYGFAYLPGSGLKGMARAFAHTVWLPGQADRVAAERKIREVFGTPPASRDTESTAGAVVFHDAWPDRWPRLHLDIVNNHHRQYYGGEGAPGDWDEPNMVSFLAIGAGETFSFALSKRHPGVANELVDLGRLWLAGALTFLGAGAKTSAGYGYFKSAEGTAAVVFDVAPPMHQTTLDLVTPAFLAGANQQESDCDLRPATLRGLLRWWWRTMHAGFVDVPTLRRLEATVWGDTHASGAVRLIVEPVTETIHAVGFDKEAIKHRHRLQAAPDRKTTQGLWYHSYGMDERNRRRYYVAPGARWVVCLVARPAEYPNDAVAGGARPVGAAAILQQAQTALWLLCRFGGVGSKARKGFGSFADLPGLDLEACKKSAAEFRATCGVGGCFNEGQAESSSLEQMLPLLEQQTNWTDPWFALDQVGFAAQGFAQGYKHRREKKSLGLPRRIGDPQNGQFRTALPVRDRHAAPVHYHLGKGADGRLVVRVTAFPASKLPDLVQSRIMLERLLEYLEGDLARRVRDNKETGMSVPGKPTPSLQAHVPSRTPGTAVAPKLILPKAGERVEAVLLAEKTRKGGWVAKHEATGLSGAIVNSSNVPSDKQPGGRVTLVVASVNTHRMEFRWPKA